MRNISWIGIFSLALMIGVASADWLPNQTPENQQISISTVIDVIGFVEDSTQFSWVIASPGSIPTGMLGTQQSLADLSYRDNYMTNGGHTILNKNVDFDSGDQTRGGYNLETEKVLTYTSIEGSHMLAEEEYTLSVAGSAADSDGNIKCVFGQGAQTVLPSFCNIVSAKSSLTNMNSAQISTRGQVRAVAASADVPAELNYQIAVTPDTSSGSDHVDGIVKTVFAGSIMEGRDNSTENWNKTAATNDWKDVTEVYGGIKNFQKTFGYKSGLRL
ncbi:MAG: hypothetical protein V1862_11535 [Methanobacteriota archaeon]